MSESESESVYFSHWDQMKYSSVSVAIDQTSAAPMMDTTTLIAPPMPSVSLTHSLLHSHSFIYLSPSFCSLTPPFQRCGTQTETNHRFNEIRLGGRHAGGAFVSHVLTAAAVAHLSHLTDSTSLDDSSKESFQHNHFFTQEKTASRHTICKFSHWE